MRAFLALGSLLMGACGQPNEVIPTGVELRVRNSFQSAAPPAMGGTGGAEVPIEALLSLPDGAGTISATVAHGSVEIPSYLGFYAIDAESRSLRFSSVTSSEPFPGFFRTIEAGTFDRYYVTFQPSLAIQSAESSDPAVRAEVRSDGLLVTVGEGYNTRGAGFTITLR